MKSRRVILKAYLAEQYSCFRFLVGKTTEFFMRFIGYIVRILCPKDRTFSVA